MNIVRTTYSILKPAQRRSAIVLFCLVTAAMVLETVSVGMIVPTIAVMTQPDIGVRYPALQPVLTALGQPTQIELVVAGIFTLVGLHLVKVLFLMFLAVRQNKFVYGIGADISRRLFAGYLRRPWTFHLQRNSAGLVRNIVTEAGGFSKFVMLPIAVLIGESMVALGITTVLFIVQPSGAVFVIAALGLAALGFQRMMRRSLQRWGEARQHHEGVRMRHLQEGLGGVKDIKLLGREADFIAQYWKHAAESALASQRLATVQELPRLMLELLAMIGLAVLVLTMMYQGSQPETMLPVVGLFATAAFRLMPSVTRIMTALQSLRYGLPIATLLSDELTLLQDDDVLEPPKTALLSFRHTLSLEGVGFDYPGAEMPTLTSITLAIPRGTSIGFVGSSGAGKTTLVDIILGLLPPGSGRVSVDGTDIQTNLRGWQDVIGYVPQNIFLTDDSLRRNIALGLTDDEIDAEAVRRALHAAQLDEFVASLPQGVETHVGERGVRLSGGQRQRIGIARALYHDPQVLVLDEATSALDSDTEAGVMDAIKALRGEKTILIVAHRLSTVANCDRLIRLDKGAIVEEDSFRALVQEAPAIAGRTGSLRHRDTL